MKKVLVICGPTASGKSAFAIECAKRYQSSIISGDSIQVYQGLDIGSGKITKEEMQGIPHRLLDIMSPKQRYNVALFQKEARREIDACTTLPILVGGTGLYLKACLYDYVFSQEEEASSVEPSLEGKSDEELYAILEEKDPIQAQKIHPHNRRRILRSLTILARSGKTQSEQEQAQSHTLVYDAFFVGCTMEIPELYARINQRVEEMFAQGLEKEVKDLLDAGVTFADPGFQGIGYKEWKPYFAGECSLEEVKAEIQKHSRNFAKRQYTWLRHQMPVHWFCSTDPKEKETIWKEIELWKQKPND